MRVSHASVRGKPHLVFDGTKLPEVALIRKLPRAEYKPELKCWAVPFSPLALFLARRWWPDPTVYNPQLWQDWVQRGAPDEYQDLPALDAAQNAGARFLRAAGSGILADEVGVGKTRQAIAAADTPCLITCPAGVVDFWLREIETVHGSAPASRWTVLTHDHFVRGGNGWPGERYETLIVDEAHRFRNNGTLKESVLLDVASKIPRVICLTATPIVNRVGDLFNLLAATKKVHPKTRTWFETRYADRRRSSVAYKRYKADGLTNEEELKDFMKDFTLRRSKEEAGVVLPEIKRTTLTLHAQVDDYLKEERAAAEWLRTCGRQTNQSKMIRYNHLRRLAALAKIEAVRKEIATGKNVVACSFLDPLYALHGRGDSVLIEGGMTARDRDLAVRRFQGNPLGNALIGNALISTEAGGVGLTLTAAWKLYVLDLPWSPVTLEQIEGRIYRRTQTRPVEVVYVLLKDSIDDAMWGILNHKQLITHSLLEQTRADETACVLGVENYLREKYRT